MAHFRDTPDRKVARLAGRRHQVATLKELLACGLSRDQVFERERSGHYVRRHRGVYMIGTDRLTPEGEWLAAVLACGPEAVLSHESAAGLWGILTPILVLPVHVTCPTNRRRRPGLIPHRGDIDDRRVRREIPVTPPARTISDLPPALRDGARIKARVNRLLLPHELGELTPRQRTRSALERRFLHLVKDLHPEVNAIFEGRERDFAWPEHRLCVEIDGPHHQDPAQAARDRARDRTLIVKGWRVLHAGEHDLVDTALAVRASLR